MSRTAFVFGSNGPADLGPLKYADRHAERVTACFAKPIDATGGGLGLLGARLHTRNLEVHAILHALAPYPATETSLSSGGWNEVTAAANARVDILHFIGHANYDRARNEAGVVPIVGRQWTKVSAESARLNWRLSCWRPSGVQDSADAR
jgi:hypothetical protein